MLFKEAEARLTELLNRHASENDTTVKDAFGGVCQINGSNNQVVIHVHYACCDEVLAKMGGLDREQ